MSLWQNKINCIWAPWRYHYSWAFVFLLHNFEVLPQVLLRRLTLSSVHCVRLRSISLSLVDGVVSLGDRFNENFKGSHLASYNLLPFFYISLLVQSAIYLWFFKLIGPIKQYVRWFLYLIPSFWSFNSLLTAWDLPLLVIFTTDVSLAFFDGKFFFFVSTYFHQFLPTQCVSEWPCVLWIIAKGFLALLKRLLHLIMSRIRCDILSSNLDWCCCWIKIIQYFILTLRLDFILHYVRLWVVTFSFVNHHLSIFNILNDVSCSLLLVFWLLLTLFKLFALQWTFVLWWTFTIIWGWTITSRWWLTLTLSFWLTLTLSFWLTLTFSFWLTLIFSCWLTFILRWVLVFVRLFF